MSYSRIAIAAGVTSLLFAWLGVMATVADPRVAAPVALIVAGLLGAGLVMASQVAFAVAIVVATVGYAIGGIRGVNGAVWAAIAAVVSIAGVRICCDARRPARIAIGAQRSLVIGQVVVAAAIVAAALLSWVMAPVEPARIFIVIGVAASAAPLFLFRVVNRDPDALSSRPTRVLGAAVAVAVICTLVVVGARAADHQRSLPPRVGEVTQEETEDNEVVQRPSTPELSEEAPPPGEWIAALASLLLVLVILALLASGLLSQQPIEFEPDAMAGEGDGTFTDSMVEDPMAVLVTTEDAAAVLRQALVAIEEVDDPRQAIRLAYSLVEAGFGDLDARRGPSESESEYLSRLLPGLGASADSMRRLTDLFEQARFSAHSITEDMRADAVGSLAALRDELTVVVSQRAAPDAEGDNA